jgi:hypothetical protein
LDRMVGFNISPMSQHYLSMVANPLDTNIFAKLPDNKTAYTTMFVDWNAAQTLTLTTSAIDETSGFFLFFSYGWNLVWNQWTEGEYIYQVLAAPVGADGLLYPLSGAGPDAVLNQLVTANYADIYSLSSAIRILSGGLRGKPLIELNTNSTQSCVARWWGGFINPQNLADDYLFNTENTQQPIFNYVQNDPLAHQYSNADGVCVRLNPFFQELQNFYTNTNILNQANDFGMVAMPYIFVQLSVNIPIGDDGTVSYPVYFSSKFAFEVVVEQPSPIMSQQSPVDPHWPQISYMMNAFGERCFPNVSPGDSFHGWVNGGAKFLKYAKEAMNYGTRLIDPMNNIVDITKNTPFYLRSKKNNKEKE